jgi:hypothetical protein
MPIATANGKEFNFPEGTTQEQMGAAIDEYFKSQEATPVKDALVSGIEAVGSRVEDTLGAAEVGLSMAGGLAGDVLGGASGLIASVNPFTDISGGDQVKAVQELFKYDPRTPKGKEYLQAIGGNELVQGIANAMQKAEQYSGDVGYATGEALGIEGAPQVLGAAYSAIPTAVSEALGGGAPVVAAKTSQKAAQALDAAGSSLKNAMEGRKSFKQDLSVSAAQTPAEIQRAVTAESMPVPFEGESALTKGQVSRNFEQLQFEKETAKRGELGAPLRDRVENQSAVLIQNLDALTDIPNPFMSEYRDIGKSVDNALKARFTREKKKVNNLYDKARAAGEMKAEITLDTVPEMLDDIRRFEGQLAPNAGPIRQEAIRVGVVDENMNALPVTLENAELFRSFVNEATDLSNPQQSRIRRMAVNAIDDATETAGGDIFKEARKARAKMGREFENVGITKRLLAQKKGTDERSIAYEDVFKKIMLDSPIEEINKLRGTLLKAGPGGKQAWADLKAKGIEHIKEGAQSASQMDSRGNPILSTDKLNKSIAAMDRDGKLEAIYGKKNAQVLRDLGDLAKDIHTAPPGAINHSNTASALQVALDSLAGFAVTGIPAPVATTLSTLTKYVKGKKEKAQIMESLNYLKNKGK